ncbi:MAG: alpha/beta fold hydrolase [Polyangiaceae bacterium]
MRIPIDPKDQGHLVAEVERAPGVGAAPMVVLVHGVGGSAESLYLRRAAVAFRRAGFHTARLNMRGAGVSVHDVRSLYHAGLAEDVAAAVTHVGALPDVTRVAVVGFSLGGNVSLGLAGGAAAERAGTGASVRPSAFVSVSAPLDLDVVSRGLESFGTWIYRRHVVTSLVAQAKTFRGDDPTRVSWNDGDLERLRTIRAYDDLVIAPMHGFRDAADYYAKTSAGPVLGRITTPTLILHAEDDPMVPGRTVRPWLASRSEAVSVGWTDRGGHVAFVEGTDEDAWTRTWAVRRAIDFVARHTS